MLKTIEPDSSIAPLKYFLLKVASLKYLYIVLIVVCLVAAFLYNKFAVKVYEASASLRPSENKTNTILSSNQLFSGLQSLQSLNNIENDVTSLSSFELVYSTATSMNLEISYFRESSKLLGQTIELYGNSPFTVSLDKSHIQPIDAKIYLTVLDESSFRLTLSQKHVSLYNYVDNKIVSEDNTIQLDTICNFNATISNKILSFSVALNRENLSRNSTEKYNYYIKFNHLDFLAKGYLKKLDVEKATPLASIINIKFSENNLDKTITFLNRYLDAFLDDNLTKKNNVARSTVNFIDKQITERTDSLVQSESALRNYKSANQVMDLSFQGQRIYEQMTQIQNQRAQLQATQRYYNYVINSFKMDQDVLTAPSAMNVSDPIVNQLITALNDLISQRATAIGGSNPQKNIFLQTINDKINTQKQIILENFTSNLNTLELNLKELDYRESRLSQDISKLPRTEMNMVSMQRKFNVNDAIYTYLLQKRSEAAISLASNYPDYDIIEPARAITSKIVSPKKTINYLMALFFGLFIPTLYLLIRDFFDDKIRSINDAEYILHRSVLSIIYSNNLKSEAVVAEFPKSAISESFRNLRSSLFLKSDHEKSKVILITSSQPQDGKSFVSLNLSSSIASVGYKTILIDCDLRRPTLHIKLKEDNAKGLTNFMIKKASAEEIVRNTTIPNLDFISAGPVIPNPSEMLESGVLDSLINYLKTKYDYILIDTTPMGIVADAVLLMKYSSKVLMIIRNNFTRKDIFATVLNNIKTNKLCNYDIVYNDLSLHKSSYRHYSNYYIKN
ncbi:MAG: polysaccharide biosynthesis tyrosine autokinase [Bacteroidota bacterium]|nr:polysaccharide biosynthesis tyrosine autokinase [Bacteroidota bacterium]